MANTIARDASGAVKLVQGNTTTWFADPTSVVITAKWGNSIGIDYLGKYYYSIPFPSLDTINGSPAPDDIDQQTELIATEVFTSET